MLLGQAINLSLILESSHIRDSMRAATISWFGEMQRVFWKEFTASIPLLAYVPAPGAALWLCWDVTAMKQRCAEAPAWLCHWEGTPEPHSLAATSSRSKWASSPCLQPVWLVRHEPGKIPVHNKPPTDGKNVGCRDPELPQPSWEFPSKR